jgi:hypothetical protein
VKNLKGLFRKESSPYPTLFTSFIETVYSWCFGSYFTGTYICCVVNLFICNVLNIILYKSKTLDQYDLCKNKIFRIVCFFHFHDCPSRESNTM